MGGRGLACTRVVGAATETTERRPAGGDPIGIVRALVDRFRAVPLLLAALLLSGGSTVLVQAGPSIAAASDLKFALDEIAARFRRDTGKTVRLTYGSSGNFYRQIQQGAPFELFLSADEEYVGRLAQEGLTVDGGARYATGRIVLFVPKGSTVKADPAIADLRAALTDGRLRRFAIANPEHAPYGRAARQALEQAGLWAALPTEAGSRRERLAGGAVRGFRIRAGRHLRAVARAVARLRRQGRLRARFPRAGTSRCASARCCSGAPARRRARSIAFLQQPPPRRKSSGDTASRCRES